MVKIALLGRDISYTKSYAVYNAVAEAIGADVLKFEVFDAPYYKVRDGLSMLFRSYDGFFVAKPYISDMNKILPDAGVSVNVVRCADRTTHNTYGIGFIRAVDRNFSDWRERVNAVLVLGTGNAACSVVKAVTAEGKKAYVLGRSMLKASRLASMFDGAELYSNQSAEMVVNCTPLGTRGEDALFGFCVAPSFEYAFDLVYLQSMTPFLYRCLNNGSKIANGTDMFIYQAIEGDKIILKDNVDTEIVYERAVSLLRERGVLGDE